MGFRAFQGWPRSCRGVRILDTDWSGILRRKAFGDHDYPEVKA
jgi:hypothetical protein